MAKKHKSRKLKSIIRRIKRCVKAELEDGWNKSKKIHQDMQFRENVQRLLKEFLQPIEHMTATFYISKEGIEQMEIQNETIRRDNITYK